MFLWTVISFLLFPTCFWDPQEANKAFSSWTPKYSEFSSVFWTYCNTTPCILLKMIRAKENWIFHCENTWLRYYEAKLVNNSCKPTSTNSGEGHGGWSVLTFAPAINLAIFKTKWRHQPEGKVRVLYFPGNSCVLEHFSDYMFQPLFRVSSNRTRFEFAMEKVS